MSLRLDSAKLLPIHLVVEALERNVLGVSAGKPLFGTSHDSSFPLNVDFFNPLPKVGGVKRLCFIDGGSAEIVGAPNFAVGLTRMYFCIFEGDKRVEAVNVPNKVEFYTVCYAVSRDGQIYYRTELIPLREEWFRYLPAICDLEFNSLDRSIMLGLQRAPISRMLDVTRVFAEWHFSACIIAQELRSGDVLVRDGTLQTWFTNEVDYAERAYQEALKKKVFFTGLSKTSMALTDTSQPLFPVLNYLSESSKMKNQVWYYYPIAYFNQPDHKAELFAVKLHSQSDYVFKFEVLNEQVDRRNLGEIELIISALAENSKDISFPGYPYGLIDADKFARVTMTEKTVNEYQFRAAFSQREAWDKISKFVSSSNSHDVLNKLIR